MDIEVSIKISTLKAIMWSYKPPLTLEYYIYLYAHITLDKYNTWYHLYGLCRAVKNDVKMPKIQHENICVHRELNWKYRFMLWSVCVILMPQYQRQQNKTSIRLTFHDPRLLIWQGMGIICALMCINVPSVMPRSHKLC